MTKEPDRPDLPDYVVDPVKRQDVEELEELRDYVLALIEYKQYVDFDEVETDLPQKAQTKLKQSKGPTYLLEMVKCGDNACGGCPHGPYIYGYQRKDGEIKSWYVGKPKANPAKAEKAIETESVKKQKS